MKSNFMLNSLNVSLSLSIKYNLLHLIPTFVYISLCKDIGERNIGLFNMFLLNHVQNLIYFAYPNKTERNFFKKIIPPFKLLILAISLYFLELSPSMCIFMFEIGLSIGLIYTNHINQNNESIDCKDSFMVFTSFYIITIFILLFIDIIYFMISIVLFLIITKELLDYNKIVTQFNEQLDKAISEIKEIDDDECLESMNDD